MWELPQKLYVEWFIFKDTSLKRNFAFPNEKKLETARCIDLVKKEKKSSKEAKSLKYICMQCPCKAP